MTSTAATTGGSSPSATFLSQAADRFSFNELLLSGRAGSIYRAHDRLTDQRVLLKLLPFAFRTKAAKAEFEQRARDLARRDDSCLVPVLDFGYHYGLAFVVNEDPQGIRLSDYLRARGPLPWKSFAPIFEGLVTALVAAHPLVHGDVQPSHVALTGGKYIERISLFGFAFPDLGNNEGVDDAEQTRHASSVSAIAPEQLLRQPCDHRLDLYSLGATAYELLSGKPPFETATVEAVFSSIYEPPPPLREVLPADHKIPQGVLDLIERLLEKSPENRPENAEETLEQFRAASGALALSLRAAKLKMPSIRPAAGPTGDDIVAARPKPAPRVSLPASDISAERLLEQTRRVSPADLSAATAPVRAQSQLAVQLALLLAVFFGFVAIGWFIVMRAYAPEQPPAAPPAPEAVLAAPDDAEDVHSLFEQIGQAIDDERFGAAESLLQRVEGRENFPRELSGTLRAYRSRLDLNSKLRRAERLEESGRLEEALLIYNDLADRYPHHVNVPKSLGNLDGSFVLEVRANVRGVVAVDDEPMGVTPFIGLIPVAAKRVAVSRRGYRSWSTAVAAKEGARLSLDANLQRRGRGEGPDAREINLNASPFMDLMEMELE